MTKYLDPNDNQVVEVICESVYRSTKLPVTTYKDLHTGEVFTEPTTRFNEIYDPLDTHGE